MRNLRTFMSLLGMLSAAVPLIILAQNLLSIGVSDYLQNAIIYYRQLTGYLFDWFPTPEGYGIPNWYRDAWIGSGIILISFTKTYQSQGGRLIATDALFLMAASVVLMGFILTIGAVARLVAHTVGNNSDGLAEERDFVVQVFGSAALVAIFLFVNAALVRVEM